MIKKILNWFKRPKIKPATGHYRPRFVAVDRYGVRRIYDNELKMYVDSDAMTPDLIARWEGKL